MRVRPTLGPRKLAIAAAVAALPISLAQAQTKPADDQLDAITVTAQRTRQKLQDIPASVTAFSPDALDRLQIQTVADVSRLVPNVKFDAVTGGTTGLKPYIRGGGVPDGGQIVSESEVGVYVDDVFRPRLSAGLLNFVELDRIEVLRGPQGVLYGRNSSGGAVNIITRAPEKTFGGNIEVGYGSFSDRKIKGYVTGALSDDGRWRGSFQGMVKDRDGGAQHNVTLNKDVGAEKFDGFQGDLAYVGDQLEARLSVFSMHIDGDGQWSVPNTASADGKTFTPSTGSYRTVASPVDSYTHVRQEGASLKLTYNLPGLKLTSITGYSKLSDAWRQDFSGGVSSTLLGMPGPATMLALFDRSSDTHQHQLSQEFQAAGQAMNGKLDYVAGLYYFSEKGDQYQNSVIFFSPIITTFKPDTTSVALFGQATYHATDRLDLILGGRQTSEDKKLDGTTFGFPYPHADKTYHKFTPKFGADYKLAPDVLAYASYSEGFKAGGYNGLAMAPAEITNPYLPQTTKAYELGVKAELLNRTLRLNAAYFFNDIKDRQQNRTLDDGSFIVENYSAELQGLELEVTWRVAKGFSIWGNAAFNNGKYKSCSVPAGQVCAFLNAKLPVFPDHSYALGIDYDTKVGRGMMKMGADYSIRDAYYSTFDNTPIGWVPKQKFLNAYVGYDVGNWSYQLAGKNLTQQEGWQTGFGFSVVQPRFAIPPRSYMATVRYRF